ncbi:MAG TPA: cytochrome C nitrite reductase [Alphaproteobacteria bacterium]
MTGSHASLRALYFAAVFAPAAMLATGPAQAVPDETFTRIATIPIPGNPLLSFDISWVDPVSEQYFLADRSNASLDVFSASANTLLFQVPGFIGFTGNNNTSGPDGVLTTTPTEAWVGDGNSTVKVIDLSSRSIVDTISTGGKFRADEMCFDSKDQIVVVANNADTPPFLTFISSKPGHAVLGKLPFPTATDGIEQCQWWSQTGLVYLSVPQINNANEGGEVAVIDPRTRTVVNAFPQNCSPAGLAIGPNGQALVGCNGTNGIRIIRLTDGSVVQTYNVNGADEAWFNPGDGHYFVAAANNTAGALLAVIDSLSTSLDQTIGTAVGDHSVAAEPSFNHVFVPLRPVPTDPACTNGCIAVYAASGIDDPNIALQELVQMHGGNIGD